MVQDFHREYAKGVKQFCNSLPPSLGITAQMLDEYLRACAVYMWSFGSQPEKNLDLLNKMYTEKQVKVTLKELQKGIEEYQSEPDRLVEVPEFFIRIVEDDVAAGSSNSRGFADLQRKILTLCAAGSDSYSFDESRHLLLLHHQLNAVCSQEGVERIEAAAPVSGQDNAEILRSLMDQLGKSEEQDDQDVPAGSSRSSKAFNLANMQVKVSGTKPAFKKTPTGSASMPNLESAMADLDAMIGLQQVKDQVRTLVDLIHTRNLREKHGLTNPEMSYHLVFAGSPGTGKTTVARIMGRIYGALGILSQGHLVEVDRSGMVGRYVGETAQKTRDVIKQWAAYCL